MVSRLHFQLYYQLCKTNYVNQYGTGISAIVKTFVKPLFVLFVFTLVFDKFIKIDTGFVPYPVFAFLGLIVWEAFFAAFVSALNFYSKHAETLKNFPIPVSLLQLVDMTTVLLESFVKIIVFNFICFFFADYNVFINLFLFSGLIVLPILFGYGFGLCFVVVDIKRKYFINYLAYFLSYVIWLTPIFFPESLIPSHLQFLVYFNPIAEMIYFFRSVVNGLDFQIFYTGLPTFLLFVLATFGFWLFKNQKFKMIEIV